jgi:cell wall-associated NlpC family hydrolase
MPRPALHRPFLSSFPVFPVPVGVLVLLIAGCAPIGPRPYYSRDLGRWISSPGKNYSVTPPSGLPASESKLRQVAESYLGVPYVFGGQSREGMDCSGFVRQVFDEAEGVQLPHNASAMSSYGQEISKSDLKPGDILFFKGLLFIDHAGIYMGNGYFIHSESGVGVNYTRLDAPYFSAHFAGAKRVL